MKKALLMIAVLFGLTACEKAILNDVDTEDEQTEVSTREDLGDLSQCLNYNEIITRFISKAKSGKDYISINAYCHRVKNQPYGCSSCAGLLCNVQTVRQ